LRTATVAGPLAPDTDKDTAMLLPHLPLALALLVFLASAVAIWVAGIKLSNYTDVLSDRLHLVSCAGSSLEKSRE